jgi:hypothetical protein
MATSYPVSRRLFALAAKVETTYAVDAVPTFATNAVRTMDRPVITHSFLAENLRENWFTGGLGELAAVSPSGHAVEIDFSVPIHGTGAAYSSTAPPNIDPFLKAAGYAVAYTTGSVAYTVTDAPNTGLSVYARQDGKEYHAVGCIVTDWTITASAGEYPVFTGKLRGIAGATVVSEVDIGAITLPTTVPPLFKAATCTIGTYSGVVRSFELSGNPTFATRGDGTATRGHNGFRITRRQPEYRPVLEHADITNYNPEADWFAATQRTIDMTVGAGGGDHNTFAIDADDARVIDWSDSDEDGLAIVEPTYRIFTPSSGQELTIKFT